MNNLSSSVCGQGIDTTSTDTRRPYVSPTLTQLGRLAVATQGGSGSYTLTDFMTYASGPAPV